MSLHHHLMAAVMVALLVCGCQRNAAPVVHADLDLAKELRAKLKIPVPAGGDAGAASSGGDSGAPAQAAGWGNLSGTFKYAGTAPAIEKLAVTPDCSKFPIVNESLEVGPNGGLANVVVFIRPKSGQKIPIAPEYAELATKKIEIDNKGCRFQPHVVAVRTNEPFVIGNPDPMGHNSKVSPQNNPPINPVIQPGQSVQHVFTKTENTPAPIQCNIHSWMQGWIVIRDEPYVAITDKDGKFEIKSLPAGEWEFQVWHEKAQMKGSTIDAVEVAGKPEKWTRGRFTKKIAPGENALGEIVIPAGTLN